jgi:ABC-type Zn uptake system ZnuABC Zn-binding protein ZnuA
MKKLFPPLCLLLLCALLFTACGKQTAAPAAETEVSPANGGAETLRLVTTTYPLYLFTSEVLRGGEGISVSPMVNQSVACLHDYTLTTADMRLLDGADILILNGSGLDDFVLQAAASNPGLQLLDVSAFALPQSYPAGAYAEAPDPHFWLDPARAALISEGIAGALAEADPANAALYQSNAAAASEKLLLAEEDFRTQLQALRYRELITFHDGFAYFAEAFQLNLLFSIEEEEGQETPANVIGEVLELVTGYGLPAIFTEVNSSSATADAIARESGVQVYPLNMIISGETTAASGVDAYLAAMQGNIDVILEALS